MMFPDFRPEWKADNENERLETTRTRKENRRLAHVRRTGHETRGESKRFHTTVASRKSENQSEMFLGKTGSACCEVG